MSVLIKGMDEIPYDGAVLMVKHGDDGKTYIKYVGVMGYRMELVELPEKHGRLIDADEICFSLTNVTDQNIAEEAIRETPTVIEAEGEG